MKLDLPMASGLNFIPKVILMNCEPELSYILAESMSKGALFSRLLEGFIGGPCI